MADSKNIDFSSGFSVTTLQYFRKFYLSYPGRCSSISRPMGVNSEITKLAVGKPRPLGVEPEKLAPSGRELQSTLKSYPSGNELVCGFSPQLSWSHYRALMRVKDDKAREFYEQEAVECGWSKVQLKLEIQRERKLIEAAIAAQDEGGDE